MKSKNITYYLILLLLVLSLSGYSQGKHRNPPTPKPNDGPGGGQPGIPIDGGLSYLFVAGIAYGVYKIKRKKPNEFH